jgi:DUF4097 and DUF4098 domain-containing protein YvlB
MTLAAGALALTLLQQTDTTVTVQAEARLEIDNFGGAIDVRTWDRSAVRVVAEHPARAQIEIDSRGPVVSVRSRAIRGGPPMVDYQLTVPASMALDLSGVNTDVTVQGTRGAVSVETVQGDVSVRGGDGHLMLSSVEGDVVLENARGKIEVNSVNAGIRVSKSTGEILAETINGDIALEGIDSGSVEATTINGQISYGGRLHATGRYHLGTHNGDLLVTVPEGTNATVLVSTFNGEFSSTFPVTLKETRRGKRFSFQLGSGSGRLELESFQGTIHLLRPGERVTADEEAEEE